ncbi:hypothetical protein ABEB36_005017 [Hypothenemus hampei]|uniref:Uncharacterized protein n=1 Tax=Hypothenemus hampei TaxID=57062 RepID=A0ABD1EWQ4_HYPHA
MDKNFHPGLIAMVQRAETPDVSLTTTGRIFRGDKAEVKVIDEATENQFCSRTSPRSLEFSVHFDYGIATSSFSTKLLANLIALENIQKY